MHPILESLIQYAQDKNRELQGSPSSVYASLAKTVRMVWQLDPYSAIAIILAEISDSHALILDANLVDFALQLIQCVALPDALKASVEQISRLNEDDQRALVFDAVGAFLQGQALQLMKQLVTADSPRYADDQQQGLNDLRNVLQGEDPFLRKANYFCQVYLQPITRSWEIEQQAITWSKQFPNCSWQFYLAKAYLQAVYDRSVELQEKERQSGLMQKALEGDGNAINACGFLLSYIQPDFDRLIKFLGIKKQLVDAERQQIKSAISVLSSKKRGLSEKLSTWSQLQHSYDESVRCIQACFEQEGGRSHANADEFKLIAAFISELMQGFSGSALTRVVFDYLENKSALYVGTNAIMDVLFQEVDQILQLSYLGTSDDFKRVVPYPVVARQLSDHKNNRETYIARSRVSNKFFLHGFERLDVFIDECVDLGPLTKARSNDMLVALSFITTGKAHDDGVCFQMLADKLNALFDVFTEKNGYVDALQKNLESEFVGFTDYRRIIAAYAELRFIMHNYLALQSESEPRDVRLPELLASAQDLSNFDPKRHYDDVQGYLTDRRRASATIRIRKRTGDVINAVVDYVSDLGDHFIDDLPDHDDFVALKRFSAEKSNQRFTDRVRTATRFGKSFFCQQKAADRIYSRLSSTEQLFVALKANGVENLIPEVALMQSDFELFFEFDESDPDTFYVGCEHVLGLLIANHSDGCTGIVSAHLERPLGLYRNEVVLHFNDNDEITFNRRFCVSDYTESKILHALLEQGGNFEPSHFLAAMNGDLDQLHKALSIHGPGVNSIIQSKYDQKEQSDQLTALHLAVIGGHRDAVEVLLHRYGADPNVEDIDSNTPYDLAVKMNRPWIDIPGLYPSERVKERQEERRFIDYAAQGQLDQLRELCGDDFDINKLFLVRKNFVGPPKKMTLLHVAVEKNQSAVVSALLNTFNANPNVQDGEGQTPYDLALAQGCVDLVQANPSLFPTHSVIEAAVDLMAPAHLSELREFLSAHAPYFDVSASYPMGDTGRSTLLHVAVSKNYLQAAELLLNEFHANPRIEDAEGQTPLALAQKMKREAMIEMLKQTETETETEARDDAASPISMAPRSAPSPVPNVTNSELMAYVKSGDCTTLRALFESDRACVHRQITYRSGMLSRPREHSLLHLALTSNQTAVVDLLLEYGADPQGEDVKKLMPTAIATQSHLHDRRQLDSRLLGELDESDESGDDEDDIDASLVGLEPSLRDAQQADEEYLQAKEALIALAKRLREEANGRPWFSAASSSSGSLSPQSVPLDDHSPEAPTIGGGPGLFATSASRSASPPRIDPRAGNRFPLDLNAVSPELTDAPPACHRTDDKGGVEADGFLGTPPAGSGNVGPKAF